MNLDKRIQKIEQTLQLNKRDTVISYKYTWKDWTIQELEDYIYYADNEIKIPGYLKEKGEHTNPSNSL